MQVNEDDGYLPSRQSQRQISIETSHSLEPHHSQFVFIDTGKDDIASGGEEVRKAFEKEISKISESQLVYLIIQGSVNTYRQVKDASRNLSPVVIVDGTGRLANALAMAYTYLHSPE